MIRLVEKMKIVREQLEFDDSVYIDIWTLVDNLVGKDSREIIVSEVGSNWVNYSNIIEGQLRVKTDRRQV